MILFVHGYSVMFGNVYIVPVGTISSLSFTVETIPFSSLEILQFNCLTFLIYKSLTKIKK